MEDIIHIVNGLIAKDHKYQKIAYELYRGYALKIVFRYIFSYEKALDVTNDGFVKLLNNFESFRCTDPKNIEKIFMGWIRRIMINTAIDELRRNTMIEEATTFPSAIWDIPDNREADQVILYNDLLLIIKKLPMHYRIVFNMYVIDGYKHQEIAQKLGITVGGSKSTLSRARTILQHFIEQEAKVIECSH